MRKMATRQNTGAWTTIPDTCKLHSIMNVVGTKKLNIKRFLCTSGPYIHGGDKSENQVCPDIWCGFDLVKNKFVPAQFDKWNVSPNTWMQVQLTYWSENIKIASTINVFSDLINYTQNNPPPSIHVNINMQMDESDKANIHFVALHYLQKDAPKSYTPIKILGDGNWFSRAAGFILHC